MHSVEWTTAGAKVVSDAALSTNDFEAISTELKSKGVTPQRMRKVALVAARRNAAGEQGRKDGDWTVTSISRNGAILSNKDGGADTYQVSNDYFALNYEKDKGSHEAGEVFRSSAIIVAIELKGGADIVAPWGERQEFGDAYLVRNGNDVYAIDAKILRVTYAKLEGLNESSPGKTVLVKRIKRVFDGFLKIDEAVYNHSRYDGSLAQDVRRLSLERGDSAGAILLDCKPPPGTAPRIWLVEQFRYSTYEKGPGWIQEVPTGVVETGDDPAEAVRREVREETGLEVDRLELASTFYPSPGGSSERIHLYFGRVDGQTPADTTSLGVRSEGEDILLVPFPAEEFIKQARIGDIDDAKTLVAGLWLGANWDRVSSE